MRKTAPPSKKPRLCRGFLNGAYKGGQLLDLAFLIHYVFANDGVVLFHFELVRRSSFVLIRGIEMTCTGGGIHSDLVSHRNSPLNLFAARANLGQHLLNTLLVDNTHTLAGYAQSHETFLRLQPEAVLVQVGQKTTTGAVLCV
jgi:hypothetical protein